MLPWVNLVASKAIASMPCKVIITDAFTARGGNVTTIFQGELFGHGMVKVPPQGALTLAVTLTPCLFCKASRTALKPWFSSCDNTFATLLLLSTFQLRR